MRKILSSMFGLSLAVSAYAAPPEQWASRGPGGGGAMFSPAISPHNPDELFVACDMTPQFHSKDFGRTWTTISFLQLVGNKFSAVRFTTDPNILWTLNYAAPAGSDCCRPCVSRDGGKTWELPDKAAWPADRVAFNIYVDFDNPDRIFASTYLELWASVDGGRTWESKFKGDNKGTGLVFAGLFCDGDTIYAGTNAGLLHSSDGGKSFSRAEFSGIPTEEKILSMAGSKAGDKVRLIAVTAKGPWAGITGAELGQYRGVYTCDPSRKTWEKKTSGINEPAKPFFVAMARGNTEIAYLGGGRTYPKSGPVVYKTSDGGESWSEVFIVDKNKNIATGWAGEGGQFGWSWPEYVLGIDVCPTDPQRVVITDLGTVHATADGGASWRAISTAPDKPRSPGEPTPKTGSYTGNGIEPTACWHMGWLSENVLFAGFSDIRGCRSTDGGATWSWDYKGQPLNATYYSIKDNRTGISYLANSSVHDMYRSRYLTDAVLDKGKGGVLVSTDDGATWKPLKDFGKPTYWLALDKNRPNRMLASVIGTGQGIYMTEDLDKGASATWTKLAEPPRTAGRPASVHVLDDGTFVATYSGRRAPKEFSAASGFFISTDAGKTWEDRSHPGMQYWTHDAVLDPTDPQQDTFYVGTYMAFGKGVSEAGRQSGLYRTTDRGRTWTMIATGSTVSSGVCNVQSAAVNPENKNELYFTTEYDGLWYTDNATADQPTFTQVKSYLFANTTRVFFNPHKRGEVWVLSFGNGIYVGQSK